MASITSRRLPISCENCRQRKIRCLTSDDRAPCDTCLRRGYASTCQFKRESVSQAPAQGSELLRQISDLTGLLKQNIEVTTASLDQKRDPQRLVSPESDVAAGLTPQSEASNNTRVIPTGRLHTSASNHVRCVPFNRVGDASLLEVMQEPVHDTFAGFPFTESPVDRRDLLHSLPPSRQCDELKDIFLSVFSPLFHILHEPTFEARYREFKHEPQSAPLSFLALLFVVFSLAVNALDDHHSLLGELGHESTPIANRRCLAALYRTAAMRCLVADKFMSQHNLCTFQCLVLLIYAFSHAGGPTWTLLGTTLHIAIAIGCSVDPSHLNVDVIEAEERRRCWAGLMMLYTIQSTCFGNIMPFRVQSGVSLPADIDDEELMGPTREASQSPPRRLTQMSYLLCKFRLYSMAFDICQLSSSAPLPPRDITMKLDQQLVTELRRDMSLFEDITTMPFHHVAHFYIVSNYTHHLFLLLHRPYLGAIESASATEPLADHIRESCRRCSDSAVKILSNFESFHSNPELKPYHWYINGFGSFHAFLAITTLLVLMAKGDIPATSHAPMATAINTCMGRFKDMAARSDTCAKAIAVLEPLLQTQLSGVLQPTVNGAFIATPPYSVQDYNFSDVWDSFPQLENLVREVPCQQWLTPSVFPWGT